MKRVNIYEAKTRLSQLVEEAASGRVDVSLLRPALAEMGFAELPVSGSHAERLASLPPLHEDPFDRMLVAQSLTEPLVLLTNDGTLAGYGDVVKVV